MRVLVLPFVILLVMIPVRPIPQAPTFPRMLSDEGSYVLAGGQNGTWFQPGQSQRLERISLYNDTTTSLNPAPGQGTVWGGGWNGSQMLISGWGTDSGPSGSNPYLYLYNGQKQVDGDSQNQYAAESSWHGGDIFAASYNGQDWLLSGMGSGSLNAYGNDASNHMGLAMFDGYTFTDLSFMVPRQQDAILYANAWNGTEWLVGGGYDSDGVLFAFNGTNMTDLTTQISGSVLEFGSVQSIGWNGQYWLIGGSGFLAKYDGQNFTDLTSQLQSSMTDRSMFSAAVNAVSWNGSIWMIGGGPSVAQTTTGVGWLALYDGQAGFTDLDGTLPNYVLAPSVPGSSVLSICHSGDMWVVGGYSSGQAMLLLYDGGISLDISYLVNTMSYVDWVDAGFTQQNFLPIEHIAVHALTTTPATIHRISMKIDVRREGVVNAGIVWMILTRLEPLRS